jgi:hypothetical protein
MLKPLLEGLSLIGATGLAILGTSLATLERLSIIRTKGILPYPGAERR